MRVLYGRGQTPIGAGPAHRQVVDIRGPTEFIAGIKEMRDQLASIAQTLGVKAAE